jgi:hypothetical protein
LHEPTQFQVKTKASSLALVHVILPSSTISSPLKSDTVENTLMLNCQIWDLSDYIMTEPTGVPFLSLIRNHIWRELRERVNIVTTGLKFNIARVRPIVVRVRVEDGSEKFQVERVGVGSQHIGYRVTHGHQGAPVVVHGKVSELWHHALIKETWDVLDRMV